MDNANVAEATFLQSAVYAYKIWQIARKSNSLYFLGLHAFSKVWLKLVENCSNSNLLKILSELFQNASNGPKLNSKNQILKVPYICSTWDYKSQIFIRFALPSALFKILHILRFPHDSHVKFQSTTTFKILADHRTFITLYSRLTALLIIKFCSYWIKTVGVPF